MFASLWKTDRKRRNRSPLNPSDSIVPLESRLLLSASAGSSRKHSVQPQATTFNFDGFWSGYAMNESTTIQQNGKRVQVTFNAPSNWEVAINTPIQLLETAVGKGKVKGDRIHYVLKAEAHNANTNEFGTAKFTFDQSITDIQPSYVTMSGTVKITLDGRSYQTDEFASRSNP